jgi:hypothetical protein
MNWVDHPSYFGPDRRRRSAPFRLLERRRENLASDPPTLAAAFRRLRMHVIDVETPQAAARFADQVKAVALLAEVRNRPDIAAMLAELHLLLCAPEDLVAQDPRVTIDFALNACAEQLVGRPPRRPVDQPVRLLR